MTLVAGTKLGPYEILAPIGAGGMGEVYRARDPRLGREVAIKVLPASFSQDADRLKRFEQEARAAGVLNHPGITAVHDIGTVDGAPYIVTELLEGETLRSRLGAGAVPARKAIDYAVQIAKGLAAAHEKGIVHRDLKPENLFLTNDGRVKILDFGLAKLKPETGQDGKTDMQTVSGGTEPGIVLGTMGYMAPEQVRGKTADRRSDLFAFGTILYEMLSGQRAFRGDTAADTITAILSKEPPDLSQTNRDVHPGLDRIVRHCLEKNPEERFESARDLAFDLEALSGVSAATGATPSAASARRRSFTIPLVAAVFLLGGLLGVLAGRRAASTAQPKFQRLTFQRGTVLAARFGPDAQTVYFSAAWEGAAPKIFQLRPGNPESSALALPPANVLGVSGGGEIAVQLDPKPAPYGFGWIGTLARAPLSGGAPKEVLQDVTFAEWAPGGTELAVVHHVSGKDRLEYPIGKALFETGGWIQDPRFSADGRRIAFIHHPASGDGGAVALVELDGKSRELSAGWATVQGLAWAAGGEIWFTAVRQGIERELHAVTPGGRLRLVRTMQGTPALLDMAGSSALVTEDDYRSGIFALLPGQSAMPDLAWFDWSNDRSLSPDGKLVLLDETGEGGGARGSVYLRPTDGSPAVRLGDGIAISLSRDGAWALTRVGEPDRFVIVPVKAGQQRELPTDPYGSTAYGDFFPDGSKFAFVGAPAGHGSRVYVQPVSGGAAAPISAEGINPGRLIVSPDARFVAASGPDLAVHLYPTAGGTPVDLSGSLPGDNPGGFTADGKGLYVSQVGNPCRVAVIDVATGRRSPMREIAGPDPAGIVAFGPARVTPDGRTMVAGYGRILSTLYRVTDLK